MLNYSVAELRLTLLTVVCAVSSSWAASYKRVETAPSNWAGNYLLVAVNNSNYYSWNGTFGSWGTCAEVGTTEISQDKKTITLSATSAIKPITIAAVTGGYSIYGNSSYLTATDKKFNPSETAVTFGHIALNNDGTVIIQKTNNGSNDYGIRYNYNNGSGGFRVYKDQETANAFYLYKEEAPIVAYTVTFSAGTNGTCSTTSLTEATPGAGVTLPACTPNTGYGFLGWTATNGKATIDNGLTAGATYKPSANTPLYAVYGALYQVTIEEPTNGTLAVTCGGNDVTSGEYYAVGQNINIVATPSTGYKFRNLQVVDATTHTFTASNEKEWTMGDHDITIKANFDEIVYRTITWSVNGNTSTIAPTQVEKGTNITFPTGLADINGKKFMGWSENPAASSAGDIVSGNVAASDDATYYAVFADVTPGDQETVTFTCNESAVNTSYTEFNRTDSEGNTWNLYAVINKQSINSTDHYFYLLNSNANGYKISSPVFDGNVKSVKAWVWNTSNKETRSAYLCSSTETAQPTSGDLGSLTVSPSQKNSEMTFTLEDEDFTQFNIYTSATIYFEKIEVTYGEDDVIANYTTTPAPASATINITTALYATYVATIDLDFSEADVIAYAVTPDVANDKVTLSPVTTVPAGKAIVVKGTAGEHEVPAAASAENFQTALEVSATAITAAEGDEYTYYYLGKENDAVGFRPLNVTGTLAAGKCFFKVEKALGAKFLSFSFDDVTTGINNIENVKNNNVVYNLAGQRVTANAKGIVIVNGKKMLNK